MSWPGRRRAALGLFAVCAFSTNALLAQSADTTFLADVRATSAPAFRYALFVSSRPASTAGRPVLLVLDPRGRALIGLELFRAAADSLGWLVMSSYDSASDDPSAPNVPALNAMLGDALERWGADRTRIHIAGMSGTARVAFGAGLALNGHVKGVVMAGAGLALDSVPAMSFAVASAVGTRDFNWLEVAETRERFATSRAETKWWSFDGPHGWMPPSTASEMLRWLALAPAERRTQQQSAALSADEIATARAERAVLTRVTRVLADLRRQPEAPSAETLRRQLGIDSLVAVARGADAAQAAPARRRLAHLHAVLSFYEPRVYRAADEPARERLVRALGDSLAEFAR